MQSKITNTNKTQPKAIKLDRDFMAKGKVIA